MKQLVRLLLFFLSFQVWADEYHYKDVLLGERAAGLGGAYAGVSDDPSGILYNPAGIVFGSQNYVSLSTNAYTSSEIKFKDIYAGQDYTYRSSGLTPTLIGFTQNLGKGRFGLAVAVPNSDLIDQTDTVNNATASATEVKALRRKFFKQDITYLAGPAYAQELRDNFSIGFSLLGSFRTYKIVDITTLLYDPVNGGPYRIYNAYVNTSNLAIIPIFGAQYMPTPKLAIGLSISKPFNVGGSGAAQITAGNLQANGTPQTPTGVFSDDYTFSDLTNVFHDIPDPLNVSLGGAYFATEKLLLALQFDFYEGVGFSSYAVRRVLNWSLGGEYYLRQNLAVRLGLYSNNSRAKEIDPSKTDQASFVNLIGGSLGLSYYGSGSSISLTGTYASGNGQGQAFASSFLVQTVSSKQLGILLSGSYEL